MRKRTASFLIAVLILSATMVNAQRAAWELGFSVSPNLSFRFTEDIQPASPGGLSPKEYRDQVERPFIGLSVDGFFRRHLAKRFFVESGLGYTFHIVDEIWLRNGEFSSRGTDYFHWARLPLLFSYNLLKQNAGLFRPRNFQVSVFVGAEANFMFASTYVFREREMDSQPTEYTTHLNKLNVFGTALAGVRFSYFVRQNAKLEFGTSFNAAFTPIRYDVNYYPWAVKFSVGMSFGLKSKKKSNCGCS